MTTDKETTPAMADLLPCPFCGGAAQSTAQVSTEQAGDAWISVEDRLPTTYEEVIVWPHPTDYCMTAELYGISASSRPVWKYGEYVTGFGHEVIEMTRPVTHWMPKPAAPSPNNSPVGGKDNT